MVGQSTSRGSPLLYVVSRAVRRVKFETILKYYEWYLCQISRTNHVIIWELSRARSPRSGAPRVRKFGNLCIQEILVLRKRSIPDLTWI